MASLQRISPCLWFDSEAEEAANFYVGIFKNSRVGEIARYSEVGKEFHQKPAGSVMIVEFELEGQKFTALNGGPIFKFNEAVSLMINCESQEEVDYYWEKLTAGGDPSAQQCGWLKDKYGLSWQVVSTEMIDMLKDPDIAKSNRVMAALLEMKKLDVAEARRAYEGV